MADTTTTTYGLTKPEVGASQDSWGTKINNNLDDIDDLLDGTTAIAPNLTAGSWKVGGTAVTATAAELNLLDGATTAVSDLAPKASPTFTGTPAAPTASYGTNTTQLATTEFVQSALRAVFPIGSVYINATDTTSPATLFGFGNWIEIGAGRVLVGQNASDSSFDVMGETGGSKDAIVVSHTHTGSTNTTGAHYHNYPKGGGSDGPREAVAIDENINSAYTQSTNINPDRGTDIKGDHSHTVTINSTGSSGTNANLQPYIVVKMWKRTA